MSQILPYETRSTVPFVLMTDRWSSDDHRHEPTAPAGALRLAKQPSSLKHLVGVEVVALGHHWHRDPRLVGLRHDLSLLYLAPPSALATNRSAARRPPCPTPLRQSTSPERPRIAKWTLPKRPLPDRSPWQSSCRQNRRLIPDGYPRGRIVEQERSPATSNSPVHLDRSLERRVVGQWVWLSIDRGRIIAFVPVQATNTLSARILVSIPDRCPWSA